MGQNVGPCGRKVFNGRIKSCIVIMDSMTADELDGLVELNDSRVLRIQRGAGCKTQEPIKQL